jgi:chemotaxis protein methyltransferase CheR
VPSETLQTPTNELDDDQVQPLLDALTRLTGITIPVRKKTMVLFRLRKRFAELDNPPVAEYLGTLRKDKLEQQLFINLLTTNETSFFRTTRVWEYFQNDFIPKFHAERPGNVLKAWSAAASTGEEACSIAMSCLEFQLRHPSFRFQITATDIDTKVLEHAESGLFRHTTVLRLKQTNPSHFQRYFTPSEQGNYRAHENIRKSIRFTQHNLMSSARPFMPQDIVFLRNVLIYFRDEEKMKIVNGIVEFMAPGSILVIGESESLTAAKTPLTFVQPQIYRRNPA